MSEGLDKDTIKSELPPTYLWQNVVISQKSNQPEVIQCILYKLKTGCQWQITSVFPWCSFHWPWTVCPATASAGGRNHTYFPCRWPHACTWGNSFCL